MDDLEERLSSHARAFEGLMSLIPAKQYYGEDTSDQWKRKKQTKEQKRAAKLAKLDPANHKSAADVMAEKERKRKRELAGEESEDHSDLNAEGREQPREGMKKSVKKQKVEEPESAKKAPKTSRTPEEIEARRKEKAEKKKQKQMLKSEKKAPETAQDETDNEEEDEHQGHDSADADATLDANIAEDDMDQIDMSGLAEDDESDRQSSASPDSSDTVASSADDLPSPSSSSSILPPTLVEDAEKSSNSQKSQRLPKVDRDALTARLSAKIEAMRARRKADGLDGKPARSRQELIEARRQREEERKLRKKELRKVAKAEEDRANAEAELARLRGSGSPLTPDIFSPARSPEHYNFSFGKVSFDDGQQLDASGSSLLESKKRKGPQDIKTALAAAEKKESRLASLDDEKRSEIQEKDAWLNARRRAHGERVRDDTSLLKKTLKRKEKAKSKSEEEWTGRIEGVKKGQEMRQKKREDNLRKRREEKGKKGKKVKPGKKKARPGFEGKFGK